MIKISTGIILVIIGVSSFCLSIFQFMQQDFWMQELQQESPTLYGSINPDLELRGGDVNDSRKRIVFEIQPSWFDNINIDRALNWLSNIVTVVTGILIILRRRKED